MAMQARIARIGGLCRFIAALLAIAPAAGALQVIDAKRCRLAGDARRCLVVCVCPAAPALCKTSRVKFMTNICATTTPCWLRTGQMCSNRTPLTQNFQASHANRPTCCRLGLENTLSTELWGRAGVNGPRLGSWRQRRHPYLPRLRPPHSPPTAPTAESVFTIRVTNKTTGAFVGRIGAELGKYGWYGVVWAPGAGPPVPGFLLPSEAAALAKEYYGGPLMKVG